MCISDLYVRFVRAVPRFEDTHSVLPTEITSDDLHE